MVIGCAPNNCLCCNWAIGPHQKPSTTAPILNWVFGGVNRGSLHVFQKGGFLRDPKVRCADQVSPRCDEAFLPKVAWLRGSIGCSQRLIDLSRSAFKPSTKGVSGPYSTLDDRMSFPKSRPSIPSGKTYRADIDGLRAVAVIAVIAGHAFEGWFPRGYLGVDVFFVISGFVITHSLFSRGGASFGSFFAAFSLRRIKRLLPALLVCISLTCAVLLSLDSAPRTSLLG